MDLLLRFRPVRLVFALKSGLAEDPPFAHSLDESSPNEP